MATTNGFKDLIDKPEWRPLALSQIANAAGHHLIYDLRNGQARDPYLWNWISTTNFDKYLKSNDEWGYGTNFTAVGGTTVIGTWGAFCPSHGPNGLVGGTPDAYGFTLATLPNSANAAVNLFADAGDKGGYKIRVIGNGAGGSGKTEERFIAYNSTGTTPAVGWDAPLTYTPQTTDRYELLAGRIYMLGAGTTAAGFWKAYDVSTNTASGNLSVTNLPATIGTATNGLMLDEQYVPFNRRAGEGFLVGASTYDTGEYIKGCLLATASGATSITGQASAGDAAVLLNEYRNFQIRIVEDTTTPTACGQRRKITSHTAGPSAVYTVPTWTVTPSANAKFVIELANDLMLWTAASTTTYSYAAGGYAADGTWSTAAVAGTGGATQYAVSPATLGNVGGMSVSRFSMNPGPDKNTRHSHILVFRGASTNTLYQLDIAGGANGVWSTVGFGNQGTSTVFTTASCLAHDTATNEGRYAYINLNGIAKMFRLNLFSLNLEPWCQMRFAQSTAREGNRMAIGTYIDGGTKISVLYMVRCSGVELFDCVILR